MKTAKLFSILTLAFSLLFSASLPGQEVSERREFTLFDDPADKSATTVPGGPGNGERISRAAESSPTFLAGWNGPYWQQEISNPEAPEWQSDQGADWR